MVHYQEKIEQIEQIEGVNSVEQLSPCEYRVKSSDTSATIHNIVEASVSYGWKLKEIHLEKTSMDDIFAALSKK